MEKNSGHRTQRCHADSLLHRMRRRKRTKNTSGGSDENKLVIYCPHPLSFINPLVEEFEKQSGIKVEVVAAGSGELLKRVESEKANPLGDIFWGGSLSTMKPKANLFEPYTSANEDHVQAAFKTPRVP